MISRLSENIAGSQLVGISRTLRILLMIYHRHDYFLGTYQKAKGQATRKFTYWSSIKRKQIHDCNGESKLLPNNKSYYYIVRQLNVYYGRNNIIKNSMNKAVSSIITSCTPVITALLIHKNICKK